VQLRPWFNIPLAAKNVSVVVDIGANVGLYSETAVMTYKNAKVFAFEPVARSYRRLVQRAKKYSRLEVFNVGLSDVNCLDAQINLSSSSLANSLHPRSQYYNEINPSIRSLGSETVTLLRLDDFQPLSSFQCIDIIKIDVEGHELNVISGALETLRKARFCIIECSLAVDNSDQTSRDYLRIHEQMYDSGFVFWNLFDIYTDKGLPKPSQALDRIVQYDAVFANTRFL